MRTVRPRPEEVIPSIQRVLRRAGGSGRETGALLLFAQKAIATLAELSKPAGFWITSAIISSYETRIETPGFTIESRDMARRLSGCEWLTTFLVTIGHGPERECESLSGRGEHTLSLLLDAAASEMTEELLRLAHRKAAETLVDFTGTARYAPGYGDFSLSHQSDIVRLFGRDRTGVMAIEGSFMLIPRKSATAIVGWKRRIG
ncbi:MAG: hypothetical protein ABIM88_08335 [candidate division WOR-3 bacterium]